MLDLSTKFGQFGPKLMFAFQPAVLGTPCIWVEKLKRSCVESRCARDSTLFVATLKRDSYIMVRYTRDSDLRLIVIVPVYHQCYR